MLICDYLFSAPFRGKNLRFSRQMIDLQKTQDNFNLIIETVAMETLSRRILWLKQCSESSREILNPFSLGYVIVIRNETDLLSLT